MNQQTNQPNLPLASPSVSFTTQPTNDFLTLGDDDVREKKFFLILQNNFSSSLF